MARYIGPKQRLQRRIGEDLSLKTNTVKASKRMLVPPGQHGHKGRKKISEYGRQLKEKQKIKLIYGVLEKQLHHLYEEASKNPLNTGTVLLSLLEKRLDNVIYRAGFAPTRAAARQLVNHNHVEVNGAKMNIPSYQVNVGDTVALKAKARKIPVVDSLLKNESIQIPAWLNKKGYIVKIEKNPEREEIREKIEEQLIVEFYNR